MTHSFPYRRSSDLLPDQRSEGFPCARRVPVMDVGSSGVRSPEVVQRCKAVPSGVIADDAALVIELAVVVIAPQGLALTRLQSSLDLMRDVAWAYQPDHVQECAGLGFAVRDVVLVDDPSVCHGVFSCWLVEIGRAHV